jgi:3-hydroxyisobutyrate dehydrogenase-like beta-hydroxyacid dehydrogenase
VSELGPVGVVGLGNIGGALARNLVADGAAVTVYDSDAAKVDALVEAGARPAVDLAALAASAPITLASLPTPEVVEAVAVGWMEAAPPDAVFVDLSTNAPRVVEALGARLAATGRHLLECPLTGGAPGAQQRMLVFMVGGAEPTLARVRPLLDRLGRATFHVGPLGRGNVAKLVNSLIAFQATVGSLEALAVAVKAGIDLRTMVDVIRTGGAGNVFTDRMVEGVNERGRPAQFSLALAAKDAALFGELAGTLDVPAPVSGAVAAALRTAAETGLGGRDFTDLVELIEREAGVRFRLRPPSDGA